jgi:anti-sigma B factor antagonist
MCGRNGRGKSTDPTGKFSPAARAATSESSMRPFCLNRPVSDERTTGGREAPVKSVEKRDGATIVSLAGELDLYNAEDVRAALLEACADEPNVLVVDLAEVTFIDSTALGVLIEARSRLADRNGFRLAAPGLETRRALEVSGLDRHFSVFDAVADALATGA